MDNDGATSDEKMFQRPSRNLHLDLEMTQKRRSRQKLWQSMDFSV